MNLSGRERVSLALNGKETDRIPIAMVCSGINGQAWGEFEAHLRKERGLDARSFLGPLLDIQELGPVYKGPRLETGEDYWGVRRKAQSYGPGAYDEIDFYPLAAAESPDDLVKHRWPDKGWFDYSVLPERIAQTQAGGEKCLMVTNGNIFESSWYMRGFERFFEDLILRPNLAREILRRVTDFYVEHFRSMLASAKGGVDLAFTADDIAGQNGLLMSLSMWEEFIKPCHVRLNRAIHEFGTRVIYHSDGAVMQAVDGLIDMGVDILQPLQFSARGMDPVRLKGDFGRRLSFEGGVSVQTTLPFGSPEDVRHEVEGLITVLGKNGGYILGPSHVIQDGTPPQNITALFDTAANFYPF